MTTNILAINLELVNRDIKYYKHMHSYSPKYLIMSNATLRLLKQHLSPYCEFTRDMAGNDYLLGVSIAICESLKLGEIDVK